MVKVGTVWDSATEAVRGRLGLLAPIAALALFGPNVVQAAIRSYGAQGAASTGASPGRAVLVLLVSVGLMLVTFWGALAITAIVSHPSTTRESAGRQATARLLPLIGVSVALGLALALSFVPLVALFVAAGVDLAQVSTPGYQPQVGGGASIAAALYVLILFGALIWLFARLLPLVPTVLHERLGLRAIGRAFRMTRGMGWRLVGVLILFLVVLGVSTIAAQAVLGLVFRLLLGADGIATATFIGGVAGAAVGAVLSLFSYAFVARLYAALSGRDLADVFGDATPAT